MIITNEDRMGCSVHLSEDEKSVVILDQTQLPNRTLILSLTTAKEIYATVGEYLGRGLSVLIDILNPEKIVIGSIFYRCEDLLRESMEKAIKREALSLSSNVCKILPVGLGEQIGDYAALAVAHYFSNK